MRGQFYSKLLALGLLLTIVLSAARPMLAQEPPQDEVRLNPRFGLVDSFVNTAEGSAAGAGWSRVFFRWDVIQPGSAADWKPANVPDPFIEAERAAGREIVGVLIGTPAWATDSGLSTAVPPLEFWGDFVFKLATQYQGRVSRWVIWNQPDISDPNLPGHTWAGSEEDYSRLLKEAYTKIKAVDPAMQVHLAGLTYTWDQRQGNDQYLARLLAIIAQDPDAAANNYFFDAVSYHFYYDPLQMADMLAEVQSILNAAGQGQKPIWINETNAPPSEDFIEPPAGAAPFEISLEEQSHFVIQTFALALAGGAERIAFNKLRSDPSLADSIVPFGLLRADNSRRPAFDAFRTAAVYFSDVTQADWTRLQNIIVVTLTRGDQTTTVLWNMSRNPVSYDLQAIATEALLIDERGGQTALTATGGAYRLELPAAVCTNGDYCFIGGAPWLVVEAGTPDQRAPLARSGQAEPAAQSGAPEPAAPAATPAAPPTPVPVEPPAPVEGEGEVPPAAATLPAVLPETEIDAAPPPAAVFPDSDLELEAPGVAPPGSVTSAPTVVPPVTLSGILRPERLLWLFLIGIIVFTVTYGIQVAIWYRLRR